MTILISRFILNIHEAAKLGDDATELSTLTGTGYSEPPEVMFTTRIDIEDAHDAIQKQHFTDHTIVTEEETEEVYVSPLTSYLATSCLQSLTALPSRK